MRPALAVLLLVATPGSADDPPPESLVLARLLDSGRDAVRSELRSVLASAEGAAALERVAPLVRTDRGRELVAAAFRDLRAAARKDEALVARLLEARLSTETLWRLGLGSTGALYYDARTFARVEMGIERLSVLEYLVCPAESGKGYECLAGLAAAEWEAFAAAYAEDGAFLLRWRGPDGIIEIPLADALPWAKARPLEPHGLLIGGNHDERANLRLPPHETAIQVGIARRAPTK